MIVMEVSKDNRRHGPVFACDVCQEKILHTGSIYWLVDAQGMPANSRVYHLHKQCTRIFEMLQEKDVPGSEWSSDEITNFVVFLGENFGIQDWKNAQERARFLSSF